MVEMGRFVLRLEIVSLAMSFISLVCCRLILLVLEAGIDIDLGMIKLIGTRGIMIAVVGSFLPVILAAGIALALGYEGMAVLAAGCTFAPTSLGIAMNVLRQSNIVNTPVGQLIVAAAIIDDMIALVILSQLQAFTSDSVSFVDIVIPVLSAVGFLLVGGALAVSVLPQAIDMFLLNKADGLGGESRGWTSLAIMFTLLLLFMPMTYYAKASPLMGAFLAGLVFCSNHDAHQMFVSQFKRLIQWLLRIFFAASIGFQVPIGSFASSSVVLHGAVFTLALLGKILTGFMVPNFSRTHRFTSTHMRDCLVVGFSMMAEGEFAFVIAVFAVSNGMMSKEQYASVVLAVLVSTIIAPFCLRYTVARFNRNLEKTLKQASTDEGGSKLEQGIRKHTALFYRIQTKSLSAWGLQMKLMEELTLLDLEVIDHRSWHDRESDRDLINEVFVQDLKGLEAASDPYERDRIIEARAEEITSVLSAVIDQPEAAVRTQRWIPNLPEGCFDQHVSITEHIARAAHHAMQKRENKETTSMLADGQNYASMGDPGYQQSDNQSMNHLDSTFEGRLEGFFRHDSVQHGSAVYHPYQSREGVELAVFDSLS